MVHTGGNPGRFGEVFDCTALPGQWRPPRFQAVPTYPVHVNSWLVGQRTSEASRAEASLQIGRIFGALGRGQKVPVHCVWGKHRSRFAATTCAFVCFRQVFSTGCDCRREASAMLLLVFSDISSVS